MTTTNQCDVLIRATNVSSRVGRAVGSKAAREYSAAGQRTKVTLVDDRQEGLLMFSVESLSENPKGIPPSSPRRGNPGLQGPIP